VRLAPALILLTLVCGTAAGAQSPAAAPNLTAALEAAQGLPRLYSLLVSWRGSLVAERYFNGATASRPANVKSVSKSIISALVGIAIERRLISGVKQPIASYFRTYLAAAADAPKRQITIEDLLTMRSGIGSTSGDQYGAWVRSGNWVRHALNRPLEATPGTTIEYSTGNSHLLSAILTRVSRQSTLQFANEALARPLGFAFAPWMRDPQGVYFGGNEMLMTPRQMVAFGELYLNDGRLNGRQIVPRAWIEASLVARGRSYWSDQEYGYGWWIRDLGGYRAFYAWGFGGQYIFVLPELDLVVVTTSSPAVGEERRSHRRTVFDVVERMVIPAIAAAATTAGSRSTPRAPQGHRRG
jgi:CubicO group peptidase (beta-lactamase class C family)